MWCVWARMFCVHVFGHILDWNSSTTSRALSWNSERLGCVRLEPSGAWASWVCHSFLLMRAGKELASGSICPCSSTAADTRRAAPLEKLHSGMIQTSSFLLEPRQCRGLRCSQQACAKFRKEDPFNLWVWIRIELFTLQWKLIWNDRKKNVLNCKLH